MNNRSIHPRVTGAVYDQSGQCTKVGRTTLPISHTAKPPRKPAGGHLRKTTAKFDRRQRDYQATINSVKKQASAFTMPGSRRLDIQG